MPKPLALVLPALLLAASAPPAGPLASLSWLTGCWELRAGDRLVEEQWMAPRGTVMLGMARTTVGGVVREYEHTAIREEGETLVYRAIPSGQPPAEFRSVSVAEGSLLFASPGHDFPQRIRYRTAARGDSLLAAIEGTIDGRARVVEYPYARVPCATPAR